MKDAAAALLAWYDEHRRQLPWRAAPGLRPEPYHVWLSEIMLQQTTVATVGPYFADFIRRWPHVEDLAAAELDQVLHAWQGLGYYARARNLHKCAQTLAREHGGRFPETEAALRLLPGIGAYTAAAIAAIAFDVPATVVDGNVERVVARLFAVAEPLPGCKPKLRELAATLTPRQRAGDFAQAAMDLGATVCTARQAFCQRCPLAALCAARRNGVAAELPRRDPKPARPTRYGIAFWAVRDDGAVLLRRRVESGLLGGMIEVPSTAWRERPWQVGEAEALAPVAAAWRLLPGQVEHTFTHFHLVLQVLAGVAAGASPADGFWCRPADFAGQALPTVMKKLCRHGLAAGTPRRSRSRRLSAAPASDTMPPHAARGGKTARG